MSNFAPRRQTLLISMFIFGCLFLQTCGSFGLVFRSPVMWPFLNYPMYANAHVPGDAINQFHVIATLADGSEVPLTEVELGLKEKWHFWNCFLKPLLRLEGHPQHHRAIRRFVSHYEAQPGRLQIVMLRVEDRALQFTGDQLTPLPARDVMRVTL